MGIPIRINESEAGTEPLGLQQNVLRRYERMRAWCRFSFAIVLSYPMG